MIKLVQVVAVLILAHYMTSCRKNESSSTPSTTQSGALVGSCVFSSGATAAFCIEYRGSYYSTPANLTSIQNQCTAGASGLTGTFTNGALCSTTSRVGSCLIGTGTAAESALRYFSPTFTASSAQSACGTSGTFVP